MIEDLAVARLAALEGFAEAYNRHDFAAIMAYFTDDIVFDSYTGTEPWGTRFVGRDDVGRRVRAFLQLVPDAQWLDARHSVAGDRGFSEWTYVGTDPDGSSERRAGVDVFVFDGALIVSKSTYQKMVVKER